MDLNLKTYQENRLGSDICITKNQPSYESFPNLLKELIRISVRKSSKLNKEEYLSLKSRLFSIIFSSKEGIVY